MIFKSTLRSIGKLILVLSLAAFSCSFTFAQNPIVAENLLPGSPSSEWDVNLAGDLSIQGFATDISVEKGSTVHFKIDVASPSTNYRIKIYRLGYYQGNGARLIEDLGDFSGTPQPFINNDPVTGLTDCSSWSESASWNVPYDAVSGVYIVKLTRADNNGSSHMVFIVRDDLANSPILFKTSDATWQAYNHYRYHSLYVGPVGVFSHAVKVSYNRPFYTRDGLGGGNGTKDWLFNAEYPMIRWLERNGYNVSYTTDLDMDRDPTPITPAVHKILLSVGHDEYWSAAERLKFENARDAGVHLAFFSGDEVYWKTRWEDNHRTLVCYKEGTMGEYSCGGKCDPEPGIWTGLWRDGCTPVYQPNDGCRPETPLSGQISWSNSRGAIEVPAIYKNLGFWRHTSIASSTSGLTVTLPYGTLGDEWDAYQDQYSSTYPPHRIIFSSTFLNGETHNLSLYRANSGALVFAAGTMQWSWGLDENHDNGNSAPSTDMQQATVNILADMGVLPTTIQSGLIASATGDNISPTTVITFPSNGATLPGDAVTISGTSQDAGGGVVAGVEISVDGGTTWHPAYGTSSWIYSWQPSSPGQVNIKARAWDDLGNLEVPGIIGSNNNKTVTISGEIYYSVFQSVTPSNSAINYIGDGTAPLEMGMKFRSNVDGYITGLRYYKGAGAQGVHIGNLWSSTGSNLATATFTGETASGWQTVTLTTPVAITANTIYVVSYFSPHGDFIKTVPYFTSNIVNGPLTGLGWTETEPNGVYRYNSASAFPNNNAYVGSTNFWADVLFTSTAPPDLVPPSVVSVLPANNATAVLVTTHPSATFSESLDPSTVNINTVTLTGPGSTSVSGTVTTSNGVITFTPDSPLAFATTYVARLKGGTADPRIKDTAGNALAADYSWQFSTETLTTPIITQQPVSQSACNGSSVSFYSTATGTPTPTLQWQVSSDNGNTWQDLSGAVTSPLTFTTAGSDNAKQFHAVWTNSQGPTTSNSATLTIIPSISATISVVNSTTCPGSPFQLQLVAANGQSPYSLLVNGKTYNGVTVGQPFTTISTSEESLWTSSTVPDIPAQNDGSAIEIGVKFKASVNGFIKGIRFYKGTGNTNIHTGTLWSADGTSLATASFTNETSTGWQEVRFSSPVAITANTTYIASYFTNSGHYSLSYNYFSVNSHSNGSQLQAPAATVVGGNGVYKYGVGFPNSSSPQSSNYWVDVVFSYSNSNTVFNNNLTSITDNGGCISTGSPLSSAVFNLNATATSAPSVSSPVIYCQFSPATPLTATGTNLLWFTTSSGGTGSSTAPTPSTTSTGTTSYYVSQTVTGCEGPRAVINVIVNSTPSAPTVTISQPNCNVALGAITVTAPTGADMLYSINGTNYQSSVSFNSLPSGNYSVTAKNSLGCISSITSIIINPQPETPAAPTANITQPTCSVPTGTITVTSSISGLSFSIDGINYTNTTGLFAGVSPGTYNLTAKNISNCISTATIITLNVVPGAPIAPTVSILQPTCFIGTGTITVTSTLSGLSFSLNGLDYSNTTGVFSDIVPGTYHLTAKNNSNNCLSPPTNITVFTQPETPAAPTVNVIQPTCSVATGTITVTSPTTGLYFSIDDLQYANITGTFNDVSPGTYNLTAKNSSSCISTPTSVSVIAAPPAPTGAIQVVSNSTCPGSPFELQLTSATGQSPLSVYNLVINGITYNGVSIGQTFASINTTEESIWTNSNIPNEQNTSDGQSIEVGVKFRAAADGYIHGIRFYKGYGNAGTHTGSLWTTGGTLLAHATFTNETYSGWQEVRFDTPIAILANTTYIASYHAPTGHYARDYYYFGNPHFNGRLLQATGAFGNDGNGVFKYTSIPDGEFPNTNSAQLSNYWVDVVFSYSNSKTTFTNNLTSITENGGCTSTSTNPPLSTDVFNLNATATAAPTVNTPVTYCQNSTAIPLTASGISLLWYTASSGGIGSPIAPIPSTVNAGTTSYFVSQTITGCESSRTQINVVINALPTISAGTYEPVCIDASDIALAGSPSGGTFTGTGVTGNLFDPSVGTQTITYTYTDAHNCTNTASTIINVNALPEVSAGRYDPICIDANDVALSGAPAGGAFTGTGVSGNLFDPSVGTQTITYTYSDGNGCTNSATTIINVNNLPQISAGSYGPVCIDAADVTLAGTPPGGTFSGIGVTGNLFDPSVGTQTISYTYSDGNNCTNSASTNITVNTIPGAPIVNGPINYCLNSIATPLTASGTNLLWYTSSSGGSGSQIAPTPTTSAPGTIRYYVSQSVAGCESPRAYIDVIVNASPTPTATITAITSSTCPGSPFQLKLSAASPSGGTFNLVINGKTYSGITVDQIFTTINTSDGSLWTNSTIPNIEARDDINAIELGVKFTAVADGYISGIRFYKGSGNIGTHTGSLWTTSGILLATATFSNETSTGWQEVRFAAPVAITANTTYVASYFAPNGHYSMNQYYFAVPYYPSGSMLQAPAANGSNGNGLFRYYSAGFPGTNSPEFSNYWVDVLYSYSNSSTQIINNLTSITQNGGCVSTGNPISSTVVNLNPPPAPTVTNVITYCIGATAVPLSATGSSLLWYTTGTGGTGSATAPTPSTISTGTTSYYVSQTVLGCESPRARIDVVVSPVIIASVSILSDNNNVCAGTTVTYTASPINGGTIPTFQWYKGVTPVGTNAATYSYTPANGDMISVVMTSNASPCLAGSPATSNTVTMTVNSTLNASVAIAADVNPVCNGSLVTFTATPTHGGSAPSYQWYNGITPVGTNAATYSYTPANGDVISVVMTSNASPCLAGSPATSNHVTMVINPVLTASVTIVPNANPVNTGISVTFTTASINGGQPIYQWYVNNLPVGTGTDSYTYNPVDNDHIYVVMTSNLSCLTSSSATSNTVVMTVNPLTNKTLNVSVLLQGLYNGGGIMRKAQDGSGDHYTGTTADQITIELHDANSYGTIVYTANNINLDISGSASTLVPGNFNGSYYITIKHRNSIETTSSSPVSFNGSTINYAFDLPSKAHGNNLVIVGASVYAIYGGDVNQDGLINLSDMNIVLNDAANFSTGYIASDVNGDGIIDSADMIILDNNASASIGKLIP